MEAEQLEATGIDPTRVRGAPRVCTLVGGSIMLASGLFPWFVAGPFASDPLRGLALVASVLGLAVVVSAVLVERAIPVWQTVAAVASTGGVLIVAWAAMRPPVELTASLGVGGCAVGAVLTGVGLFAARWRRDWAPPEPNDAATELADDFSSGGVDEPSDRSAPVRSWKLVLVGLGVSFVALVAYVVIWPAPTPSLGSRPSPTTSYDEAVERFDRVVDEEADLDVFEPCHSQLMTHGERVDVAVVLFHGLTNCPKQFVAFGDELFDAGANVVILRAPDHGLADASGTGIGDVGNLADFTADALRAYADESVDIATGLGEEVRVLGLSMGGVVAAWTAHERDDIERVVAVAPAMTIPGVPASLTQIFRNVVHKLPDFGLPGASKLDHAYAGGSTKGLAGTFGMGAYVADQTYAGSSSPTDVTVVLNPDDDQVDPIHLTAFASAWAARGSPVVLHRLPDVGLPHDVIDGDQPGSRPALVYPILRDLLAGVQP